MSNPGVTHPVGYSRGTGPNHLTEQTSYTTNRPKPRQTLQATRLKGQREKKRDGRNNKKKKRKPPGRGRDTEREREKGEGGGELQP